MSKSTRRIGIAMGDTLQRVGELIFETDGRRQTSLFRYALEWLDDRDSFPLAPNLPLSDTHFHSGSRSSPRSALPGPVADGAPDAWGRGLIRKARRRGLTELDYLLAVDDTTRQGALRYLDEAGQPLAQTYPPVPRLNELDDLRRLVGSADEGFELAPDLRDRLIGSAGSLGGARPKATVRDDRGALAIAKFTSAQDTMPVERMEAATLALARDTGLNAASAHVELKRSAHPVAVIQRFDRTASGRRTHYLSAQSFLGVEDGTDAYYTDIADMLRAHAADAKAEMEELYRRILFTILVSNNDDHLKNHGLLSVGGGRWSLAPAFDINPQPYRRRHLETGISEQSGNAASIEAALEAAPFFDISADSAASMLARMATTVRERWRHHGLAAGMTPAEIKLYEDAFDHEETSTAQRLAGAFDR